MTEEEIQAPEFQKEAIAEKKGKKSFEKGNRIRSSVNAKGVKRSEETKKNISEGRQFGIAIKTGVYDAIRSELLDDYKNKGSFYQNFIHDYLKYGKEHPESKAADTIAKVLIKEDIIEKLDSEREKALARDVDFNKYRVLKLASHSQQLYLSDETSKAITLMTSRRYGKTTANQMKALIECMEPNRHVFYINVTQEMALQQFFNPLLELCDKVNFPYSILDKDGYIEFPNGSWIKCFGNSNQYSSDKMQGYSVSLCIIDETQSQRNVSKMVDIIRPAMADYARNQIVYTGTPPRIPGTYFEKVVHAEQGITHYFGTLFDNPFIANPEELIDQICKEKGLTREDTLIQREFYGKEVYDKEARIIKDYTTFETIPINFRPTDVFIGIDWGASDYNSIILLEADLRDKTNPNIYASVERKFNNTAGSDTISIINDVAQEELMRMSKFGLNKNNLQIICDTNEKSLAFDIQQKLHLPTYCAYKYDKQASIDSLATGLRKGLIKVKKGGILEEEFTMSVYKRDENDNILFGCIDDDTYHPDAMDALRYAYRQIDAVCGGATSKHASQINSRDETLPEYMRGR